VGDEPGNSRLWECQHGCVARRRVAPFDGEGAIFEAYRDGRLRTTTKSSDPRAGRSHYCATDPMVNIRATAAARGQSAVSPKRPARSSACRNYVERPTRAPELAAARAPRRRSPRPSPLAHAWKVNQKRRCPRDAPHDESFLAADFSRCIVTRAGGKRILRCAMP
jgi:hypothetical protein